MAGSQVIGEWGFPDLKKEKKIKKKKRENKKGIVSGATHSHQAEYLICLAFCFLHFLEGLVTAATYRK